MSRGGVPYLPLLGRLLSAFLHPARWPDLLRPLGLRRTVALLVFVPPFLALQLVHWMGLLLDEVVFPGYRRVSVREPLFVVGLPRSGTSYLQRVLAADRRRFTTLRLWELLLAPSVTERKALLALAGLDRRLGAPARRVLEALQRAAFAFMEDVHPVDLSEPEEDYFLLLPAFACFLLVVPFPYHPAVWALARFDALEAGERRRLMALYRGCVQRHLFVVGPGRTLLSKNPSFTPMVRSLVETFPDARLVCSLRDPEEGLPSLLSSLRDGARAFGWDVRSPDLRDRFVSMLQHFADHAVAVLGALPEGRHAFVPLPELRADVEGTVTDLYRRFGWEPAPAFRERLREETRRARRHRSRHRYSLEEFGLEPEDVRARFASLERFELTGAVAP